LASIAVGLLNGVSPFVFICRCRDRMVVGLQLPGQSVPITTIIVSSNRARMCTRNIVERGVKHHSTNPELIWGFITELIRDNKNILSRSFNLVSILVYARYLFTYNFVYSNELEIEDTADTRKATSYLNSVTLKPIFIMYNIPIFTRSFHTLLRLNSNAIFYPKVNVSFFLDDLDKWIRPWLFLFRGSSTMWSQSLILRGPWVAYLALIILLLHFDNNFLFMLRHIWGFFVYFIWQSCLTSSAYICCVPLTCKCTIQRISEWLFSSYTSGKHNGRKIRINSP